MEKKNRGGNQTVEDLHQKIHSFFKITKKILQVWNNMMGE